MQQPSQVASGTVGPAFDALDFIREYKILASSCCDKPLGWRNRKTGALICRVSESQQASGQLVPCPSSVVEQETEKETEKGIEAQLATLQSPLPISQAKYSWMSCRYSPNLKNMADVKTIFVWNLAKYQVCAAIDEEAILDNQAKVRAYAYTVKPMTRKPEKDEMVIGVYQRDYYRARVVEVKENGCDVIFVDFGDVAFNNFDDIIEPNDAIMDVPILSVAVKLYGLEKFRNIRKMKGPAFLNDFIFGPLKLAMEDELKTSEQLEHVGELWVSRSNTLNNIIFDLINGSQPA